MDLKKLMSQALEMQERMQRDLQDLEVEAAVGGGMVSVRMNGTKSLLSVSIDPEVLDPEDPQMVQDLILSAVNEAGRKVDSEVQQKIGSLAPGLAGLGGLS